MWTAQAGRNKVVSSKKEEMTLVRVDSQWT